MTSLQDKFSKQVQPPKDRIITNAVNELHQTDIMHLWSSGGRYPYHYILVEIDAYSRYVKARALKKKSADETLISMKDMHGNGFKPNRIETDSGSKND